MIHRAVWIHINIILNEAIHRRAHTVGFHIYDIQMQTKVIYSDRNPVLGVGVGREMTGKECQGTFVLLYIFWMVVAWLYLIVRVHQTEHLKFMHFIEY